jgi:hypothetical protein
MVWRARVGCCVFGYWFTATARRLATGSSTTATPTSDIVAHVQQYQQCRACVLRVCSRQHRVSCLCASCFVCFVCFVRAASCSVVQSLLCFMCFVQPPTSASLSCSRLRCCQLSRVVCVVIRVLLGVSCFVCGICAACTSDGKQGRGDVMSCCLLLVFAVAHSCVTCAWSAMVWRACRAHVYSV